MTLQTSPESPAPVRQIAALVAGWIDRLGVVWVEGQVAQLSRRQGLGTAFLTLRDPVADISVTVTCSPVLLDGLDPPLVEGAGVVVHAKPSYYPNRGTFSLAAREIRMVGLGELLARIERRRRLLAAEGLFAAELKRRLPFLPGRVGLVTAPGSAAERDVVDNATRRWPAVLFVTAYASMQGTRAAAEVMAALDRLDRDPAVDVIVIARGGGSVEDLLPFSDEALVRAVHRARTPVVSAIGHETDCPLLDLVADVRASTPTDAAKLLVPDLDEERRQLQAARDRARTALGNYLTGELNALAALRSRPSLADPGSLLDGRHAEVLSLRDRGRLTVRHRLDRAEDDIGHQRLRARALSPLATLRRGYAVLQDADGHVLSSVTAAAPGDRVSARVADGRVYAEVTATDPTTTDPTTTGPTTTDPATTDPATTDLTATGPAATDGLAPPAPHRLEEADD